MRLNGIDFGPCLDASGVRGFFGERYWFHRAAPFWYDFEGSTFVAKTATFSERAGNMPLRDAKHIFMPRERFPRCIWWSWQKGMALNAIGLSGPGLKVLIECGLLRQDGAFMISLMPVAGTIEARAAEFDLAVKMLGNALKQRPELRSRLALQINVSCPNTGHDTAQITGEARRYLSSAYELGIPLVVKLNLTAPIESVGAIAQHPGCAAICCTNTIPFGSALPDYLGVQIDWGGLFPDGSPLQRFGGGGLSGKPLLPLIAGWIRAVRKAGITIPLNAGGGILAPHDVDTLVNAGLRRGIDSVFIGSISMLRPWNIRRVIRRAHALLAE